MEMNEALPRNARCVMCSAVNFVGSSTVNQTDRRKELRKIDAARGSIELDRSNRLNKLTVLLDTCRNLAGSKQERTTQAFRDIVANVKDVSVSFPVVDDCPTIPDMFTGLHNDHWGEMCESDIHEALAESPDLTRNTTSMPTIHEQVSGDAPFEDNSFYMQIISPEPYIPEQDNQRISRDDVIDHPDVAPDPDGIALASLYLDYRASIPRLTALPTSPSDSEEDSTATYAMSKVQLQLVHDEGKVWENIDKHIKGSTGDDRTESVLELREKSTYMSQSYERRNNPPTSETYSESKSILLAMGIPCLQSTELYEAEAVASSIVMNGYGDYVVSEDTVSIVLKFPSHLDVIPVRTSWFTRLHCFGISRVGGTLLH
jgi:flap endonuclease-1